MLHLPLSNLTFQAVFLRPQINGMLYTKNAAEVHKILHKIKKVYVIMQQICQIWI